VERDFSMQEVVMSEYAAFVGIDIAAARGAAGRIDKWAR
jgi:hypothetical protein